MDGPRNIVVAQLAIAAEVEEEEQSEAGGL